jgi:superkiller protein 3
LQKLNLFKKQSIYVLALFCVVAAGAIDFRFDQNNKNKGTVLPDISECKTLANQKKTDEAITCYNAILNASNQNIEAKAGLANLYFEKKNYAESTKLLTEAKEMKPSDAFVLNNLGNSLRDQGKTDDAISVYLEAIAAGNYDSIANLVTLYNINAKFDESIKLLNSQLEKHPDDKTLLQLLASTYHKQGNETKARQSYETI